MITLAVGATTVTLDPDFYWVDERNWSVTQQTYDRTITGAGIVQFGSKIGGRPITLQPWDDSSAWINRDKLDQLQAWYDTPGLVMSLTIRGATRDVIFRHHESPALDAKPVKFLREFESGDFFLVTMKLMEI